MRITRMLETTIRTSVALLLAALTYTTAQAKAPVVKVVRLAPTGDVQLSARPVTVHRLEVLRRRDLDLDGVPCTDLDVREHTTIERHHEGETGLVLDEAADD